MSGRGAHESAAGSRNGKTQVASGKTTPCVGSASAINHLPFELDTRDHKHNTPNTATRARPRGPIKRPFSPPLRYNSRLAPLLFSTVDKSLEASPISPRHPWSSSRFQLCLGRALLVVGLALLVVGHTRLVIGCALVIIGRALVIIGRALVIIGCVLVIIALELI